MARSSLARRDHHRAADRRADVQRDDSTLRARAGRGDHAAPSRAQRAADAVRGGARGRRPARARHPLRGDQALAHPAAARPRAGPRHLHRVPVADLAGDDRRAPPRDRQRPSVAAAALPRAVSDRVGGPERRDRDRHELPSDGRRVRHRQRARAEGGSARTTTTPTRRFTAGSRRWSTSCCRSSSRGSPPATAATRRKAASTRACSRRSTGRSTRPRRPPRCTGRCAPGASSRPSRRTSGRSSTSAASVCASPARAGPRSPTRRVSSAPTGRSGSSRSVPVHVGAPVPSFR